MADSTDNLNTMPTVPISDGAVPGVRVYTSSGPLELTLDELSTLGTVLLSRWAGSVAQDFNENVVDRRLGSIPPEWKTRKRKLLGFPKSGYRSPDDRQRVLKFDTSAGLVSVQIECIPRLVDLLSGKLTASDALAFYTQLAPNGEPFPPEWEIRVIGAVLAEEPGRDDLIATFARLHNDLRPAKRANFHTRMAFALAWDRVARSDLKAISDTPTGRAEYIADACNVLSSPIWRTLPSERKVEIFSALYGSLMAEPASDLVTVADIGISRFGELLTDNGLTEAQACRIYDCLHGLYFASASDTGDLKRFDALAPSFETWLRRHIPKCADRTELPASGPRTIIYLLHTAHAMRGNAVSPLIASVAVQHAAREDRRVILYAVQFVDPEFVRQIEQQGIEVRCFPQEDRFDHIEDIVSCLETDEADVVITEQNRALATALFERRVAPLQMWIDTGFPYWDIEALDWTISPRPVHGDAADLPSRTSPIVWRQSPDTLGNGGDARASAEIRAQFPPDAFVLGVFVRLPKIDRHYLGFLKRLLDSDPSYRIILAGPGDTRPLEPLLNDTDLAERIRFINSYVDLSVYAPAIDVMLDTFPFIGGLACREALAYGTPVVSKLGTGWDGVLRADRSPALLANTEEEYVEMVARLANDNAFMASQKKAALELARSFTDTEKMVEDVESAIADAHRSRTDSARRTP